MKQSVVYIGIDVAKAHLDVAWAGASRHFPNDQQGHAALVSWIKQSSNASAVQFICEASGGYEQDRKSTRLNSSHVAISYAVFCLKKKKKKTLKLMNKK